MRIVSTIKRHFEFNQKEQQDLIITALVTSLILFLFIWNHTDFSLGSGIREFIFIALSSLFILGLFASAGKILAIMNNYTATYSRWTTGLLVGFVITFISYGYIPIMFPGLIEVERIRRLSHGEIFPGENKKEIFLILAGTIWVIMLAGMFFQMLYSQTQLELFHYMTILSAIICIFGVLPFQKNIGLHLFYVARKKYFYVAIMSIVFGIFLLFENQYALIFAVVATFILTTLGKDIISDLNLIKSRKK